MTTTRIPQDEGRLSPREAEAWIGSTTDEFVNHAGNNKIGPRALAFVQNITKEHSERMLPLHRRWRATYYMLSGNTLDRTGPADVHVPELYKAIETAVPRIEEAIVEKDPWFNVTPRSPVDRDEAETIASYIDYQFDRARVRDLIQPAARNMMVTQCAAFYINWKVEKQMRLERTVQKKFKNGKLHRTVKAERKEAVTYYGPAVTLIDPFDFVIDNKATNPQEAMYVGHRVWMGIDEIKELGRQHRWANMDQIDKINSSVESTGYQEDYMRWTRDPTSRYGEAHQRYEQVDGRPKKLEVTILYARFSTAEGMPYIDHRMVCIGGKIMVEVRENPYEGKIRPYATARASKNGHEFYGVGPLDNAVRLNQHSDRLYQIQLRTAEVAGGPIIFAEEDSDIPDSLYKVRPFTVLKGTGPVRMTQIPEGGIAAIQATIGSLQRNINEVTGVFPIQMGTDNGGGTATEASLSLQEGNRRLRGLIRSMAGGLEQLLNIFYCFDQQFCIDDEVFPVLGKRALNMRRDHLTLSPADLVTDVRFDLIGLHSLRTYGLKATGMKAFIDSMGPFMMQHADSVDQVQMMHMMASELIGPQEADALVTIPTPLTDLHSQDEENELLIQGVSVRVDPEDDDETHMRSLMESGLYERALNPKTDMDPAIRAVVLGHFETHRMQLQRKGAQEAARANRQQMQQQTLPPEAGGQQATDGSGAASPTAGGFSDAMANGPGGQTRGENPGPASLAKYGRSGRAGRTTNQTENQLG